MCACVQVALGWPLDNFSSAAAEALESGSVDVSSLQKLADARHAQMTTAL